MSFLRTLVHRSPISLRRTAGPFVIRNVVPLTLVPPYPRTYASKSKTTKKGGKVKKDSDPPDKEARKVRIDAGDLIPGSQRFQLSPEYVAGEAKMKAAIEYLKRMVTDLEMRASGRVTPALLAPVRVRLPGNTDAGKKGVRLEEVATVGVRDGSMLIVTVFEEQTLKHVEDAIYEAKIQGVTPQKADARTIRIPIAKPTVEARNAFFATASKQAETTRMQIRKARDGLAKGFKKGEVEYEEYQKLMERYIGEVDKMLADMKKGSGQK